MPVITMPKLSDTMSEGTIASWKKKKGDTISMGDVLADIETDKATMEMEAFDDGILQEIYVEAGGKAPVGSKIALILAEGETLEEESDEKSEEKSKDNADEDKKSESEKASDPKAPAASSASADSSDRVKASPLAKKIAVERGVSLSGVTGTGPGNRIVAKDVPEKGAQAATSSASTSTSAPIKAEAAEGDERIPLSNMRKTIADRLVASKQQNPHFYLSIEVDAGPLMRIRRELNAANEAAGEPKLTVNDFVLLAIGRATAAHPCVNSSWGGDAIIKHAQVNISVAVAVEDGLVTPVLRQADKMSLKQISVGVKDLAARARDKKLKPEEYVGGTVTVSNLGSYGIDQFFAIINPPQAAIIAIGAIQKKPVVNAKNEIVVGERMNISLSGDHRVVDGAVGAEFLSTLRQLIENPAMMLF